MKNLMTSKAVRQYVYIVLGCFVAAAAYPLFLESNKIAPGGFTGIGTVLHNLFNLPIGLVSLALNVPLIIIGWRHIGARFVFKTVLATLLFSLMIDILRFPSLTDDLMVAAVFGGVMIGFGMGLILKGNATTGGTDLLARIVQHSVKAVSIGTFLMVFDLLVVVLAGVVIGAKEALYAIICVFVLTKVLDQTLMGFGTDKACYIISPKHETIGRRIMEELDRGVTALTGTGVYSGSKTLILLCVVGRFESVKVKEIVKEVDEGAFMFITDTHETLGEGFKALSGEEFQ